MASLYLLIPVSLIFCALAVAIFFWAVNSGQYDDLDGEGERILFEDDADLEKPQEKNLQIEELLEEKHDEVKPSE
ncbi:MAG: cbb3-type cytochrome oxidase assembly protein CcoS [Porticoccus sp.]